MNINRKKSVAAVAIALAASLGVAQSAHAVPIPITTWNYDLYTAFSLTPTDTVFTSGSGAQVVQPGQISWGGTNDVFAGPASTANDRSGITISSPVNTDQSLAPAIVSGSYTTDSLVPATGAWITHHNKAISGSFATLDSAKINSTLTLTPTNPALPAFPPATIQFSLEFLETQNLAGTCVVASSPTPCNDIFALTGDNFNSSFTFLDVEYFVSIFPTAGPGIVDGSLPLLGAAVCGAAGAPADCVGFTTIEGQDNNVQFGFVITSRPFNETPEPGTLAILGLSLVGLAFSRRRKQS